MLPAKGKSIDGEDDHVTDVERFEENEFGDFIFGDFDVDGSAGVIENH